MANIKLKIGLATTVLCCPLVALAGGYEITGHSTEGTGLAYAGAVSGYDDGSSAFYNPAAMAVHDKTTFQLGTHVVPMDYDFHDRGSTVMGEPNIGTAKNNKTEVAELVDLYAVHPLNDQVTVGFAVTSPFGLGMKYPDDHMARYQMIDSNLTTIQAGPSVAVDLTDQLSVGANISAIYAKADMKSAVDFGSIGYEALGPEMSSALGLAPQMNDGQSKLDADDWGLGWRVGASYRYGDNQRNRLGVNFRGKTDLTLKGDIKYTVPASAQALNSGGLFDNTSASTKLTLPEQVAFGGAQWLDQQFVLYWETAWTRWSRFNELRIQTGNPDMPDAVTAENWRDNWRENLGLRYVANTTWDFVCGMSYDQSVIRSEETRTPALPDTNQLAAAVGFGYNYSENLRINGGYNHTFFVGDLDSNTSGSPGDDLKGEWKNYIGIFSLGFVYQLD